MKKLINIVIIIGCFSSCRYQNKINIDFGDLNPKDFNIKVTIPPNILKQPIYSDGVYHSIPNEYGENDWTITYRDSLSCKFRHFKTNRRNKHKYRFRLYEKKHDLFCEIDIKGQNKQSMIIKFEKTDFKIIHQNRIKSK